MVLLLLEEVVLTRCLSARRTPWICSAAIATAAPTRLSRVVLAVGSRLPDRFYAGRALQPHRLHLQRQPLLAQLRRSQVRCHGRPGKIRAGRDLPENLSGPFSAEDLSEVITVS